MRWLVKILINVLALMVVATILPGFRIESWWVAVVAAIVIGLINTFLKPVLRIITLPITILSLGIFALILNVLLLLLAAAVVPGFNIDGLVTALIASILLAIISGFLNGFFK